MLSKLPLEEVPGISREPGGSFPWKLASGPKIAIVLGFGIPLLVLATVLMHESLHCLSVWAWDALQVLLGHQDSLTTVACDITLTHPAEWSGLHVAYADLYFPTDHYWSVPLTGVFTAVIAWMIMDTGGD